MSLPLRECGLKFVYRKAKAHWEIVTPFAGVWIEILKKLLVSNRKVKSLPLRECGLKSDYCQKDGTFQTVTPFAGVWIEMSLCSLDARHCSVTPFAGVWIEIDLLIYKRPLISSLPLRECGLKYKLNKQTIYIFRHSLCGSVD